LSSSTRRPRRRYRTDGVPASRFRGRKGDLQAGADEVDRVSRAGGGRHGHRHRAAYLTLSPTSKFGKSSLTWKAVWPGSAVVTVETDVPGQPYSYYKSTVAAAVAVGVGGYIGGRHEEKIYVAKYFKGRQKFKVKCGVAKAEETFVF